MSAVEAYIRQQLETAFVAALTCPACDALSFIDSPTAPGEKWCFLCGRSEPIGGSQILSDTPKDAA